MVLIPLPLRRYVSFGRFRNVTIALIVAAGPVCAETTTVVALGDSLTQGYGLDPAQGFVPQLQGWLAAQGDDVTVINAGVSGDTTAGGLARLEWSLNPDVDAMIVTLGGNDLLRGIDPATSRSNLEQILQGAAARQLPVLLVAMQAPGNYGPDYKTEFDAIYPELAAKYGATLVTDFFASLRGGSADPAAARAYLQVDGIHPNAEGVTQIVAALGPQLRALLNTLPE